MKKLVKCEEVEGEGSFETGILCGSSLCQCDGWSGGCVGAEPCDACKGTGAVDAECVECGDVTVLLRCVNGCEGVTA